MMKSKTAAGQSSLRKGLRHGFSRAKELNYFENQEKVSLGILKTIEEFVSGYEVEKCPLKLWEKPSWTDIPYSVKSRKIKAAGSSATEKNAPYNICRLSLKNENPPLC